MDLELLLGKTLDLVNEHKEHARLARYHGQRSIEVAVEAGDLLSEAKARLGHGEWTPWLKQLGLPGSTARRWMQLSRLRRENDHMSVFIEVVGDIGGQAKVVSMASDSDFEEELHGFMDIRMEAVKAVEESVAEITDKMDGLSPTALQMFLESPEYADWKSAVEAIESA